MRSGQPLDDQDRAQWLTTLATLIHTNSKSSSFLVLSCSALKPEYRRTLASTTSPGTVAFVLLEPTRKELTRRLEQRHGHWMPLTLLDSQLNTLSYSENELFMHFKPSSEDSMVHPPEEIALHVINKLLSLHQK